MFRKIILYIAMSLDGYIADINGKLNFLEGDGSSKVNALVTASYNEFIATVDTILFGFYTYEQIITELSPNKWPYTNLKSYVFTSKRLVSQAKEIEFTRQTPHSLIETLKQKDGKNIWVCGGSILTNSLIKENLIDEYHITIIPTILGEGIRLFDDNNPELKLKLVSTKKSDGMVQIIYTLR